MAKNTVGPQEEAENVDGGVVLGKLGITVARVAGPNVLKFLKNEAFGKKFLFVGPSWSGKTSFWKYIRSGEYTNPNVFIDRTQNDENLGRLEISSSNNRVQIEVKRTFDVKGTKTAAEQAEIVRKKKPDGLCILVEAGRTVSARPAQNPSETILGWLTDFLQALHNEREKYPDSFERIRSVLVIVNKVDLLLSSLEASRTCNSIEQLLAKYDAGFLADIIKRTRVVQMSLIRSYQSGELPAKALSALISPFL
jgi:hypothetical protein